MKEKIEIEIKAADILGECPIWHKYSQSLWRVDIIKKSIHRWKPEEKDHKTWLLDKEISFFFPNKDSSHGLAALEDGIYTLNLKKNNKRLIGNPVSNNKNTRFNDGKCDSKGNLWIGSMDRLEKKPIGNLYLMNDAREITKKISGLTISNGIGWSPNNTVMYLTDSAKQVIWEFDFDQKNLQIGNKRVFIKDTDCYPDGLTIDCDGYIWSAKWDGSAIVKYSPTGSIKAVYDLPIQRPTSLTFGGKNLDKLYITSASLGLKNNSGLNGCVFKISTNSQGRAETIPNIL